MSNPVAPSEAQSLVLLEKYVETKSRQFTINDAVSVTGVPLLESQYAIKALMEKYDCRLKVTENGDLIYDFGKTLHRRTAKPFSEYFKDFARALWTGFTYVYKFFMSIILVVYFVLFVAIVVGLAIAAMSGGKDNDNSSKGVGQLFALIFRVFLEIFMWKTIMGSDRYGYDRDEYGYEYRRYEPKHSALSGEKAKGFIASIYDFVFGPPRVEQDPLANKQEVASYLRKHKGIVSTAELQALAGWKRPEADNFMTECLAHFDGRAEISPNGTLYGDFPELTRSKDRTGEAPIVYYWDEYEAPYEVTGNTSGKNALIIFMNFFNLAGSLFILNSGDEFMPSSIATWLGWIPLVYSALFFLIPLVRMFYLRSFKKQQHRDNIRKRLMRVIFQANVPVLSISQLLSAANATTKSEEKLDKATVEAIMQDLVYDLNGELFIDEKTAELKYRFEQLDQELNDVEEARQDKKTNNDIGDIIMEA
jgi:hypothetical protein